jgi:hypothetical protein
MPCHYNAIPPFQELSESPSYSKLNYRIPKVSQNNWNSDFCSFYLQVSDDINVT